LANSRKEDEKLKAMNDFDEDELGKHSKTGLTRS
jgi:hypothetical protein